MPRPLFNPGCARGGQRCAIFGLAVRSALALRACWPMGGDCQSPSYQLRHTSASSSLPYSVFKVCSCQSYAPIVEQKAPSFTNRMNLYFHDALRTLSARYEPDMKTWRSRQRGRPLGGRGFLLGEALPQAGVGGDWASTTTLLRELEEPVFVSTRPRSSPPRGGKTPLVLSPSVG